MRKIFLARLPGAFMSACSHLPKPPSPLEIDHRMEIHGDVRQDPFFWMRERDDSKVLEHLKAENAYTEAVLAPVKTLREKLLLELKARLKPDDSSFPYLRHGYYYYRRYQPGKEHPIYARRKSSMKAPEEILLNVNELSQGHEFTEAHVLDVSPDTQKVLYAADFEGRRFYTLYVKDLLTGRFIGAPIPKTTGHAVWANDSKTIFYAKQHPETLRSQWIYRHQPENGRDEIVLEEKDAAFDLGLVRSRTDRYIFFVSNATASSEWLYLDADQPGATPRRFLSREKDHEYSLEDGGDAFYVVTNWQAKNFRLMKAPYGAVRKEEWQEVVPHRSEVFLESVSFFKNQYVLSERERGQTHLEVVRRSDGKKQKIAFPDPVYVAGLEENPEFEANFLRYRYESLNRPHSIFDFDFNTGLSELRKEQEVPTFDSSHYVSERIWAPASDGTQIPVSLVYKKEFQKNGDAPLLIYGYGSYGASMEPWFQSSVISLLNRGFVYAIAHVRGGSEMGRSWYENGKLLNKMNSFQDFLDATEYLSRERFCDRGRIYAMGDSAGGLLMGAVANLRPDLYRGIVAEVPFVDVLTSMLDETIPLTTGEYEEWGDPRQEKYYRYMAQYSPYDNVKNHGYPAMLITAGLHDSQVQYWEPAKWAAKIRKWNTGREPVLLFTEMDAGHGGASGRYQAQEQTAMEYAFLLMLDGQKK